MTAQKNARKSRAMLRIFLLLIATLVCFCASSALAAEYKPKSVSAVKLKVSPAIKTVTIGSGKSDASFAIKPSLAEVESGKAVGTWKSSNPKVATVDKHGVVTPLRKGTAQIKLTATVSGKKQTAVCRLTVKPKQPTSVSLSIPRSALKVGQSLSLDVSIKPTDAYDKSVTFRSSNAAVASVSSKGVVKAKKVGKATIYVRTVSGQKVASVSVTISRDLSSGQYRFYGIGNAAYPSGYRLPGCKKDVEMMAAAFKSATFSGKKAAVNAYTNLTGAQMRALLSDMPSFGMNDNDTTVFYYSGHGMASSGYYGALCGVDMDLVTVNTVQKYLDRVPGRVIVLLDCCLSGQYIVSKDGTYTIGSNSTDSGNSEEAEWFNQAVARAFESAVGHKALTDSSVKAKYKILTASGPRQSSYISNDRRDGCSVFTDYLAQALGEDYAKGKVSLKADANKDAVVTLKEAYSYVNKQVAAYVKRYPSAKQTTMVWPANDATPLVSRN